MHVSVVAMAVAVLLVVSSTSGHSIPLHMMDPPHFPEPMTYSQGVFYTTVYVGTPPQPMKVQVDTGSSDLVLYSDGCVGCTGRDPASMYNFGASSSGSYVDCYAACIHCQPFNSSTTTPLCDFLDAYGDGTEYRGIVTNEVAMLPSSSLSSSFSHPTKMQFGQILWDANDTDPTTVQGLWGMAYGSLSSWSGTPVFQAMVEQNVVDADIFSMCLPFPVVDSSPSAGMVFGSPALAALEGADVMYTPIAVESYYVVNVTTILVGGTKLESQPEWFDDTIVDSGTTLTYLDSRIYNAFVAILKASCSTSSPLPGICGPNPPLFNNQEVALTPEQMAAFPSIQVAMPGFDQGQYVVIPPHSYLLPFTSGTFYLGIFSSGAEGGTIFGDTTMGNYNVVFDRANTRVGFAPVSTCVDHSTQAKASAAAKASEASGQSRAQRGFVSQQE